MDRADLAEEARAEQAEDAVGLDQRAVQAPGAVRIVGAHLLVLGEGDGGLDLVRRGVNVDVVAGPFEHRHDDAVKVGDRHRLKRHAHPRRRAFVDELVAGEVEGERERARRRVDNLGPQAARRHVKGQVPAMVAPRQQRGRHLADHLREEMESDDRRPIAGGGELGPGHGRPPLAQRNRHVACSRGRRCV